MFTTSGKADSGTNLATGPFKNEGLAQLWRKIRATKELAIVDFAPYTPSDGKWVAFLGQPIIDGSGQVTGLVALQIGPEQFDKIVQSRDGLGSTGESYLVGSVDGRTSYRTDRVVKTGHLGEEKKGADVDLALNGKCGQLQKVGSTGALELSCYAPINVLDLKWALITTVAVEDVLTPGIEGQDDFFKQFMQAKGYYDLFLLDPNGFCFYTVCHEKDYQTSLVTGTYKDTNFGALVQTILGTKEFAFADFAPYAPSNGEQAAFIGAPLMQNGELKLIVALQLSPDTINEIMSSRAGMGQTGCTYLIGLDQSHQTVFRSDLTFMDPKYTIGYQITTPYIEEGFKTADAVGQGQWNDSHGNQVIAAFTRLNVFGANWGLFGKVNGSEALAAVDEITQLGNEAARSTLNWTVGVSVAVSIVVLIISFFVTMKIVRPLMTTTAVLRDIAEGEGDLTRTLDESSRDEIGEMAHWFNEFVRKLRDLIARVAGNSQSLGSASNELSATATQLADGAEETTRQSATVATATEEMSANMNSMAAATEQMTVNVKAVAAATEEMTTSVAEIARNAEQASTVAQGASELAASAMRPSANWGHQPTKSVRSSM